MAMGTDYGSSFCLISISRLLSNFQGKDNNVGNGRVILRRKLLKPCAIMTSEKMCLDLGVSFSPFLHLKPYFALLNYLNCPQVCFENNSSIKSVEKYHQTIASKDLLFVDITVQSDSLCLSY
jgi:hypothetical protein